jgi:hypothetical protein
VRYPGASCRGSGGHHAVSQGPPLGTARWRIFHYFLSFVRMAPKRGTTTPHRGGGRGQSKRRFASPNPKASETTSDIATKQSMLLTIMTHLAEFHARFASLEYTRKSPHTGARRRRSGGGSGKGCARNKPVGTHPHLFVMGACNPIAVPCPAQLGAMRGEIRPL